MIKTTSFAPPRLAQSGSNPSSKLAARQKAIKAAKARASAPPPPTASLFAAPAPLPEISAAQARELMQNSAPKPKTRVAAPQTIVSTPSPTIQNTTSVFTMTAASKPAKTAPKTPKPKAEAAPTPAATLPFGDPVVSSPDVPAPVLVVPTPEKAAATAKKAKRARVPVNLAEQYGQNISKRVENGIEDVVEEDAPKKRLSRTERAARRELMNPDDDLMARLHRAHNAVPSAKPEKRQRGWRFDCGRCGQTSYFQTTGALCRCGALAIKE